MPFRSFFFVFALLMLGLAPLRAQDAPPLSNATPRDAQGIAIVLTTLEARARTGDTNALEYFGATPPADSSPLQISTRVSHIAVSAEGALVREVFGVTIERDSPVLLSSGTQELWLPRKSDGTFSLSPHPFVAPLDALSELVNTVEGDQSGRRNGQILDVVASRVGGRWIALRKQAWNGTLGIAPLGTGQTTRAFIANQMNRAPSGGALTAHFLFQNDADSGAWTGLGAAWNSNKRADARLDTLAASFRARILGRDFWSAASHRQFAGALAGVGLWEESDDQLHEAALLDPTSVSQSELSDADNLRARDPKRATNQQLQGEQHIGPGSDYPTVLIDALQRQQQSRPSALNALRIALEYSRLAQDARSAAWVKTASDLKKSGSYSSGESGWMQLLFDHLRERAAQSKQKPTAIISSPFFTVRCWPDDPDAVALLASLEEAQHTIYADFGIPMGNTEVLLWHNQNEFARYTTQFSSQGGSEFVAALTLTKLVTTRNGPLVLGEEINTFSDSSDTQPLFGTLAHEYGHVAVRQLSKGRLVPVWFNEGIATSCEGGYDGYLSRVRKGANAATLLSMDEMSEWNVDGERAFLAYSEANSVLDFIVDKWGKGAVLEILRQIGRDVSPDDAFRGVLGVDQAGLWNRWAREGIK